MQVPAEAAMIVYLAKPTPHASAASSNGIVSFRLPAGCVPLASGSCTCCDDTVEKVSVGGRQILQVDACKPIYSLEEHSLLPSPVSGWLIAKAA